MTTSSDHTATGGRKFPDIAQYRTAVQGLHFQDEVLLACTPKMGKLKKPLHYSGAFAVAFPLLNGEGITRYAVRFWTQRVPGNTLQRYNALAACLRESDELRAHFSTFHYVANGVKVLMSGNMETYPLLRMDWVSGETPKEYITRAMALEATQRRQLLGKAIVAWRNMLITLQMHGVAHGDLWNDNIRFITDADTGDVRCILLDYDSIYVPQLVHPPRVTGSVSGYRNPFDATTEKLDSADDQESTHCDDYFSGFALLVSLEAMAESAQFWQEFGGKDPGENAFLFREADFVDPDNSALFALLQKAEGTSLKRYVQLLHEVCKHRLPSSRLLPLKEMLLWDCFEKLQLSSGKKSSSKEPRPEQRGAAEGKANPPFTATASPSTPGSSATSARKPVKQTDWRMHLQEHLHAIGLTGLTIQSRGDELWSVTGTVQDVAQRQLALQKCRETESPFLDEITIDPNAYTRLQQQMHSVGLHQLTLRQTSTGWEVHGTVATQEQYNMARHMCESSQLPLQSRFLYVPSKPKAALSYFTLAFLVLFLLLAAGGALGVMYAPGYLPTASLFTPIPPVTYPAATYAHQKVDTLLEIKPDGVKDGDRFSTASLPEFLKMDERTGIISGIPDYGGEHKVIVTVVRSGVSTTHPLYIQIDSPDRVTYPASELSNLKIGSNVNLAPSYIRKGDRFAEQGLPSGLKLDPVTGIISGNILHSGKANSAISITRKGDDHKVELPFSINAPPFPVFAKRYDFKQNQPAGPVFPELPADSPYPLEAYKFEMTLDQSLPVGLTLDSQGKITGKPAFPGATTCVINISLGAEKKMVQVTFNVAAEPVVVIDPPPPPPKPDPPVPPVIPPQPPAQTPLDLAKNDPAFAAFCKQWQAAQFSDNGWDWANAFAPTAYFGSKNVMRTAKRAEIAQDRQKLISNTYNRKYDFTNLEVSEYSNTSMTCVIAMKYNYNNGAKRGTSTMTLKLEKSDDAWRIVHFFEKVDIEAR